MAARARRPHLLCRGCGILLAHPGTSPNVRCAVCGTVTLAGTPRQPAQYPGARPSAHHSRFTHLRCSGCSSRLRYPAGASHVQCAVCNTLNQPAHAPHSPDEPQMRFSPPEHNLQRQRMEQQRQQPDQSSSSHEYITCQGCGCTLRYCIPAHSVQCSACRHVTPTCVGDSVVIVQNPATLDANGKEVDGSVALGMRS